MDYKLNKENGTVVDHIACTSCASSDALAVYEQKDGSYNATCFSCKHFEPNPPGYNSPALEEKPGSSLKNPWNRGTLQHPPVKSNQEIIEDFKTYPIRALPERGITLTACEKYGVRVSLSPQDGCTTVTHMYPYYKDDKLTGYKERTVSTKAMWSKGDCTSASLFGSHCHKPNGKTLFITEGECDALALWQVLTSLSGLDYYDPAVVSLSHGSSSAARDISQDLDYVNSFGKVVLCFDMDEAGQRSVDDACKLLSGKVYIAKYSEKDANDMLQKGKAEELKWDVLKHAKQYMPDSIVNYADCWDRYKHNRNRVSYPFPQGWRGINEKTYGVRDGDVVTITSGTGMGKTQWMRELRDHFHRTTDFKFADIALEEDIGDSIEGMISLYLNKRSSLPDVIVTEEEEKEAFDFYCAEGRWHGLDYFGGLDDGNLFSKIKWYAANGVKMIFLDHLSIIVSEYAAEGDERQRIDTIMTKLAKLAKGLSIIIFLIVHLVKTNGTSISFEEGATPSLDDLRGSGSLKQLSSTVIALSRNQQHENKMCANTSKITVLKCRFTGRTGTADYLHFNEQTGRMIAVTRPEGYDPQRGNKNGSSYRQQAF
jgi:twinkle protein